MELVHLNLRAYGPFTNKTLQFQRGPGSSALHLILGPNESGKSTALRALQAALFGMLDKRDAHLHPWDMLRVGLKIKTADGKILDVERRKGKSSKSLLFTGSEKLVPFEAWAHVLPIETPELFGNMFGLDYDRLIEGGRQLAQFKGEIGQALLAASGDLGQTVARMQELESLAGEIYSPHATARKLNKALREHRDAEAQVRRERFSSIRYKEAVARRRALDQELNEVADSLARCAEERNRLTRFETAAPHVQRFHQDSTELNLLCDVIVLAPDFESRFNQFTGDRNLARSRKLEAETELVRLDRELATICRDPLLAAALRQVDNLSAGTGKIEAARKDLPKREATLQQLLLDREKLCSALGAQPEAVPQLSLEQRRRIEVLSDQYVALKVKSAELPGRLRNLQSRIRQAQAELDELPADVDTTDLSGLLQQIPLKKQSGAETKNLRLGKDQLDANLQSSLKALPLWEGSAEQLDTARVPLLASVNSLASRLADNESLATRLKEHGRNIRSQIAACARQLDALEQRGSIPTNEQLAETRARRDLGWTSIKDRWLNGIESGVAELAFLPSEGLSLPLAFEMAVTAADSIADQLRREAGRVEQKRSALDEQQRNQRELAEHEETLELASQRLRGWGNEWTALWGDAGINPRTPLEMLDWMDKRNKVGEQLRESRRVAALVAGAEEEEKQWREALGTALALSPEQPLPDLVEKAKRRVDDCFATSKTRTELTAGKREKQASLETELGDQKENQRALNEWAVKWNSTVCEMRLSETADPGTMKEIIGTIASFWTNSASIDDYRHNRIQPMQDDEANYTLAVQGVASRAAHHEFAEMDVLAAVKELQALTRKAHENEQAVKRHEEDRARKHGVIEDASAAIERHTTSLDALCKEANVADTSSLPGAIAQSKRKIHLTEGVSENFRALAISAGGKPVDAFLEEVQATNPDLFPAQLEQLRDRAKKLESQREEKTSERDGIDHTFKLREAAVELNKAASDKYSAAARIDSLAAEYLEYRIGATLLAKAMARFRAKHQDPILTSAGRYFAALTCGSFSGLTIDYEDNQRVMRCVGSTGANLAIADLSDGTRDQLFLALRLAYIENHCVANAPCPVILDDVLMAFDDERASAALRVLQELSRKTQVFIFTHHSRHVELAKSVLGNDGFRLHELAPSPAAA